MQRRKLLKLAALSTAAATTRSPLLAALEAPNLPVSRVLLVTKCHLDVGFTLTQAKVMRRYFDVFYPAALKTAADLREAGADHYTWTTGSWLLYEYLEQATPEQRKAMEQAIAAGDIAWHALPFSWQTEMLDRTMITGALGLSNSLDARFGRKTIAAKMTDVPGHTRGIIAPLHTAGIRMLDIGVNAASTPPDVPDCFLWKDSAGNSLAMLYHRHDYGSILQIPGTDIAIDVEVRGDNAGPHTPAEITAIYAKLRAQFPGALIQASNLNEVASVVDRVRDTLPVVTAEIGDTWIYGIPSDPTKVARYRETARVRKTWVQQGRFIAGDATDLQLLRRLLLAVEHTWGTDTKSYLDNLHYRPADLAAVLNQPAYTTMQVSWQEKRDDIDQGIANLPPDLRQQAETRLTQLQPRPPSTAGMTRHDPTQPIETPHHILGLDPATGAITRLQNRASHREWASPQHPLALFTYQTLSAPDFAAFMDRYLKIKADWAPRDFGKPGIEAFHPVSQDWHPRLIECWTSTGKIETRLLLQLRIDDPAALATGNVAWPAEIYLDLRMPHAVPTIDLRLTTLGKPANRMPEAMWLTFNPTPSAQAAHSMDNETWSMNKVDEPIALTDVVRGGARSMHAISETLRYGDPKRPHLELRTLDAPVIAFGDRSPLNFSLALPSPAAGAHVSLFNNAWGTNYPQWSSGDWSFRFSLFA